MAVEDHRKRNARLAEVAQLAGVSPGLVSRILNEDRTLRVRDETRNRVLSAVEMLDYAPHASARALRRSSTGLLGFALLHVNDPIYAELVESAQRTAAEEGFSIVLLSAEDLMQHPESARGIVRGNRVDGLFLQGGFATDSRVLTELGHALPSVVFNADAMHGMCTIRPDDVAAASLATRHLVDLGHERIAFVSAEGASSDRRHRGYVEALTAHDLPLRPQIVGGWSADESRAAIERYFDDGGDATGLVVATTTSALGVHAGTIAAGRSIPGDVSVVSLNDTWFAPHLNPSLTAVAMPFAEIGRVGVTLLLEQLDAPRPGETVLADPAPVLVPRQSTAPKP